MDIATYEQIRTLKREIEERHKQMIALRKLGTLEPIKDYRLKNPMGEDVLISSLFNDKDELLIIHNMGKGCKYCTLWADGLNGVTKPLADRVPFVLVSPDAPDVQLDFAKSRDWNFPMLSSDGSSFIADLGFYKEGEGYYPGVSALVRKEGEIYRYSYDYFGPGDPYCSVWHFFDLLPKRIDGWQPKYVYE